MKEFEMAAMLGSQAYMIYRWLLFNKKVTTSSVKIADYLAINPRTVHVNLMRLKDSNVISHTGRRFDEFSVVKINDEKDWKL
jgi:Mn-dependent DtxR family transcriptional regulator